MRLAALLSGGKDGNYAAYIAELEGHFVEYIVSIRPVRRDSYMFHSVNIHLAELQAEAMNKIYVSYPSSGEKEKELKDLKASLEKLDIDGVVSGAIASNYQRKRIEQTCRELDIVHLSPLWGRNTRNLLKDMIILGMDVIVTAVAAMGLDDSWLGRKLDMDALMELESLNTRYGVDICGEGGEYESLVLDAPWFNDRIEIREAKKIWDGVSGVYDVLSAHLVPKLHKS
jgi:ABC transporter with metal-binding/Fe-S-binding domain ATP-binding protein